jgi:hypothetical protein
MVKAVISEPAAGFLKSVADSGKILAFRISGEYWYFVSRYLTAFRCC